MTPENLEIFRNNLTEAIEKHLAKGGKIIRGTFGHCENDCCPLTAGLNQDKQADMDWTIDNPTVNILGVVATNLELWSFVFGVDERPDMLKNMFPLSVCEYHMYKLGQEFGQKYCGEIK
jgi:hypothetical protein